MSVTGHLFGANKFGDLEGMFNYVLKISVAVTLVVMIVVIFLRDYIFWLFSVTGMETEVALIVGVGTILMISLPFSMISAKMLDGFGKSMYSLLFTVVSIVMEIGLVYLLFVLSANHCVLIGMTVVEVIATIIYYLFLRYLFKNFTKKYGGKSTVQNFEDHDESSPDIEDKIDEIVQEEIPKLPSRTSLVCALIAMGFVVLEIISIPFRIQNYVLLSTGIIALILGAVSIYLMNNSRSPLLAVAGFISTDFIILVFMGYHGHVAALFFIISGCLLLYIQVIIKALKKLKLINDD